MTRVILFLVVILSSKSILCETKAIPKKIILPKISLEQQKKFKKVYQNWNDERLMKTLRGFVQSGMPYRMVGLPGHQKAKEYLKQEIKLYTSMPGTSFIEQSFDLNKSKIKKFFQDDFQINFADRYKPEAPEFIKWSGFLKKMEQLIDQSKISKGTNLIWKKEVNADFPWLVLVAGYDTLGINWDSLTPLIEGTFPGADSNGSAVAIALELIRGFSELTFEQKNLMIIFVDSQQLAYQGSLAVIENLGKTGLPLKEKVSVVLALEMLGHDSKIFDKDKKLGNMKVYSSVPSSKTFGREEQLITLFEKSNSSIKHEITFEWMPNQFENSDAFRFWDNGVSSVVFTQNWEKDFNQKRYLTSQDLPETLNSKTLENSMLYLAQGIWNYLNFSNE